MPSSIDIAQAGYPCFPLSPNSKIPLPGSHGLKDATSDLAIAQANVNHSNHGIATGHHQLVVLDVDADKSGQTLIGSSQAWELIWNVLGPDILQQAMQVGTPRGGVHIYLRCAEPIKSGTDVLPTTDGVKLDVRASGGYVVAPGSVVDGRQYSTHDGVLVSIDQLPFVSFDTLKRLGLSFKTPSALASSSAIVTPKSPSMMANSIESWKQIVVAASQSGNLNLNTNDGFETITKALAYAVRVEGHPIEEIWNLHEEMCCQYANYNQSENRSRFESFVNSKPDKPVTFATLRFLAEAPSGLNPTGVGAIDLDEAKARFLFVRNFMGGPAYVDQQNPAHPMTVKGFEDGYDQAVIMADGKSMPLGRAFRKHPNLRRSVDKIIFDPTKPRGIIPVGKGVEVWNSYKGPDFPLESCQQPLNDHCQTIMNFIHSIVCSKDEQRWQYLSNWLAWNVQNPGKKPEVAVVMNGPKGCGKSTMIRIFAQLLAPHIVCSQKEQVMGRFNDHLRDKLAIGLEEAFWAGDPSAEDQIKTLITEHELLYERKNKTPETAPSYHRLMLASNHAHAIPASWDERRYFMLSMQKCEYAPSDWQALNTDISGNGLAAFYHLLMQHQLGDWHPRHHIPKTRALGVQQLKSLGVSYEGFLLHLLSNEAVPGAITIAQDADADWKTGPLTLTPQGKDMLIKEAEAWRKGQNRGRHTKPFAKGPLMKAFKKYFGASGARGAGGRDWELPDHISCRHAFAKELGLDAEAFAEID